MKRTFNKIISLILVLVMLVTMIPAGIFTANAVEADYTISSAAAWNELAAQNLTFEGKTVVLGADIDATDVALAPLTTEFKGTFDGQGYTISNATLAGGGLIAATLSGSATVKNLKLANVDVTSEAAGGFIAAAVVDGTVTITNINIDAESSLTTTGVAGGIVATTTFAASTSLLTISHLQIEAPIAAGAAHAGGVIGHDTSTKGEIKIEVALLQSVITHTSSTYSAGIVGHVTGTSTQNDQVVNISNVIVGGKQSGSTGHSSTAHDSAFFSMNNGTLNYEKLYMIDGTATNVASIAKWAAWMNGFQWGSPGREKLTIASITDDGRTLPPVLISAEAAASWLKLDENGFLADIIDPNCEHVWSDYTPVSAATKDEPGIEKRTCTKCSLEELRVSPALGWTVAEFLADYDNRTTCNVDTQDEWALLTAAGKNFEGKTINLRTDLEGLSAPLADTFCGTLNGGGHTISNSTLVGSGVIAGTLSGNASVLHLNLVNVDVSATGANAGLLATAVDTTGTVTVSKINVDENSSVSSNATAGGLFATTKLTGDTAALNIEYVYTKAVVSALSKEKGLFAGGLIGHELSGGGKLSISSSAVLCTVTNAGSSYGNGLVGNTGSVAGDKIVVKLTSVILGGSFKNYVGFWMQEDAEISYNNLFVLGTANTPVFGANRYATWINGERTTDLGLQSGRTTITIASITERSTIEAPKAIENLDAITLGTDGFIVKIGRPASEVTLDLSNYDTETVFSIKNLADWELIAASGKDFAGKKIVLDADLDGWNEVIPTLTDTFAGSFDGQGHTFANATMSGGGVIANKIASTNDIVIENVIFYGVAIDYQKGNGGIVAGSMEGTDVNVTVRRITVDRGNVRSTGYTGGLIGQMKVMASAKPITINFSKISIVATVKAITAQMQAGGLIGNDGSKGAGTTNTVTMNISDAYVNCKVTAVSYSCGLIGSYGGGNINNGAGVFANSTNSAFLNLNNLIISGGTNYKVLSTIGGVINYRDLYLLDNSGKLFGATNYGSFINGIVTKSLGVNEDRSNITAESMAAGGVKAPAMISSIEAASLTLKDSDGFVQKIPGALETVAVQRSLEIVDGTYAIRFIASSRYAMETLQTMNVQMKVVATWKDALGVLQTLVFDTASGASVDEDGNALSALVFYDYLKVYGDYDLPAQTVGAAAFAGQALAGFTIWDVPVDAVNMPEGITFTIDLTYTNEAGQRDSARTMTVSVDAAGNVIG